MGCKDTVLPEPFLKNHNVNCLTFERNSRQTYNENLCLFRAIALHLDGSEKLEEETSKIFNLFQTNVGKETHQSFRVFTWLIIRKWRRCCIWLFFFMTLIVWMENCLVSSVEEVFKSTKKVSSFYATTIKFATSTTSMHCSKLSNVLRVTHFSQRRGRNLEQLFVTCSDRVKNIYPKNVYELRETFFEELDAFNIPFRSDQKLFKNLAIFDFESVCVKENSYKQTETTPWIGKHVPVSVFYLVKLDPGTHFTLQRQSSSSHLVFYHCSRRISNSKQNSDAIEVYWNRVCNQDKTVCYTGTTQPKA